MNKRIQELARQSGGIDMTNHLAGGVTAWIGTSTPEFIEKFANLIIQESIEVMKQNDYHGEWLGEKIKEHFGVKE